MRKRHQMKGLCLFLCLCMLLPCMAATVFASDATEETSRSAATIPEGSINDRVTAIKIKALNCRKVSILYGQRTTPRQRRLLTRHRLISLTALR